jgi:hypothetical protein
MAERKQKLEGRALDSRWSEGRIKEVRERQKTVHRDTFDIPRHRLNPDLHPCWVRENYRKDGTDPDFERVNEAYLEGYDYATIEEFPEFAHHGVEVGSKHEGRVRQKGHVLMLKPKFLHDEKQSNLAAEQAITERAIPHAENLRSPKGGREIVQEWETKRSTEWDD